MLGTAQYSVVVLRFVLLSMVIGVAASTHREVAAQSFASQIGAAAQDNGPSLVKDAAFVISPSGQDFAITSSPGPGSIHTGDLLVLTSPAGAEGPFQWQRDGIPIEGETSVQLVFDPVTPEDAASYTVIANLDPSLTISAPSARAISGPSENVPIVEPVTYFLTYRYAEAVTLTDDDVTLHQTGTAQGVASVSGTGTKLRMVTVSNIDGIGQLSISIASGTAFNTTSTESEPFNLTVLALAPLPTMGAWGLALLVFITFVAGGRALATTRHKYAEFREM